MCKFQFKAIFGQCTIRAVQISKVLSFGGSESYMQRRVIPGIMQYMEETKQFAL